MDKIYLLGGGILAILGFMLHSQYLVLVGAGFAGYGTRGLFG